MTATEKMMQAERTDLAVHVDACSLRWDRLSERQAQTDGRLVRIERVAWGILALLVAGGGVTLRELLPLARALAGVP
jgi:hypothetical protein